MTTMPSVLMSLEMELTDTGAAADLSLSARTREEGRRMLFLLSSLVRASRLYASDNDALVPPAEELAEIVSGLVDDLGVARLMLVDGQVYVNDLRVRVRSAQQAVVDQFRAELDRHQIGGFSFHQRLGAGALRQLAGALARTARGPRPDLALRASLDLPGVEALGQLHLGLQSDDPLREQTLAELRASVEAIANDTVSRLAAGFVPNPLPLRRAVLVLLDKGGARPEQAALAPFAGQPGASERHLVSVCELSLMLGSALGLDKSALSELGVAALVHDVGCLITHDQSRHPAAGARVLLRQRSFSQAKVRRLIAVLEHAREDLDGERPPSLFARILHLAEHYDLLTTPRGAEPAACSPATALARMWAARGRSYDATLLALFVRSLGLYPPGTVLELTDGSVAVVIRVPAGHWDAPVVRTIRASNGSPAPDQWERDLSDAPRKTAVRAIVEPAAYGEGTARTCRVLLRRQ